MNGLKNCMCHNPSSAMGMNASFFARHEQGGMDEMVGHQHGAMMGKKLKGEAVV